MRRLAVIVAALAVAAPAAPASAARVQVMVVGKDRVLRGPKSVTLKTRTIKVGHRRCRVGAATPLSVLAATHLALRFRDYGHCGKRPQDASAVLDMLTHCRVSEPWDSQFARHWWERHLVELTGPLAVSDSLALQPSLAVH